MKTDVTKVGRLLFFVGLLGLWSCEKEPILTKESIQEVPSISRARGTFLELQYNSRGRSTAIPLEGKVDWQASTAKDLTRKLKMLYTPVALESHYAKSFIASIQQQEKVQNRVFTVLYGQQHSTQAFSGVILIHNNKGDFVKAYEYVAGKRTKTYLPKVDGQGSRGRAANNDCSLTLEDIRIIVETFGLEGLNNLIPCLDIHADLDDGSNAGGDNGLGDGNPLDVPLGDLDDNDNPGGGSSTGNGHTPWWDNNNSCTGGKVKNSNGKCTCPQGKKVGLNGTCVDDKIIDLTNNDCVGKIIEKLKQKDKHGALVPDLKGKSHLSQIVLELFDKSNTDNLTIKIEKLNSTNGNLVSGKTIGWDTIVLDKDFVRQATQLLIAKTLIHENLHLYIHFVMKKNQGSDLYKALKALHSKMNKSSNLTEHEFMSQFIEAMAYSLSAYDSHRQSMEYYTKLSWGGLESSEAYKKLKNKKEIQRIIKNERFSKKDAKSKKCE